MKSLNEIINMTEYKNHVFDAALREFSNNPEEGPALYYDTCTNAPIIYHLRNSRYLRTSIDELPIMEIPTFLDSLTNLDKTIYENMMSVYNSFIKIVNDTGYEINHANVNILVVYEAKDYDELWGNQEFKTQFDKDRLDLATRFAPLQKIINEL